MSFEQYTLNQMSAELASNSPAPGGGTAAAMSAMFGASLVEMVVSLSIGKPELAEHDYAHQDALTRLKIARADLSAQMDKDAAAFDMVMAAFKLPRATDEDKSARTQAIRAAFYEAAKEPLMTATIACGALELTNGLLGKVNENAASDLLVGAELCHTGFVGALANIAINLPSVKDDAKVAFLESEIQRLKAFAVDLIGNIRSYFYGQETFAIIRMD